MLTFLSRINSFYDLNTVYHPENNNSEKKKKVQLILFPKLREVAWRCLFFLIMGLAVILLYPKKVKILGYFSHVYKPGEGILFAEIKV